MKSNPRIDIVIVGGGVIGSSIAYFLTTHPGFSGKVLVIERDASYANGSTARSAGSIRQQFSTPENILISQFGIDFLRRIDEHLGVEGAAPDVGFVEAGYLFLASERGKPALTDNYSLQRSHGVAVQWLGNPALRKRFPWLNTAGLAAGCLGERDEGWFDPYSLLQGFKRKAQSQGVVYREDEVVAIGRSGNRITGVRLKSGEKLECGALINAAGPSAGRVATMAGVELPVFPRKRFVFVFHCRTAIPDRLLVIDPSGCYFRPEGNCFICGLSPNENEDPDCWDLEVDHGYFEERIWPLLAHRVPAFETIKQMRSWAGHYAYNTFDQNAILGPHPEVANLYLANGFSGHGLQQAPAVGRAISEWVVDGQSHSLDLRRLMYDRLLEQRPLIERNVV